MKTKSVFRSNLLLCTVIFVVSGSLGSAQAQNSGTRITDGLNGPMGVLVTPDSTLLVVDSGIGGDLGRSRKRGHQPWYPAACYGPHRKDVENPEN